MSFCSIATAAATAAAAAIALAATAGCADRPESSASIEEPVVYGTDDREDVFAFADQAWAGQAAGFTAAMIPVADIDESNPDDVSLPPVTLEGLGVCATERFADQLVAGLCSATLIAPDLVLTAGHCIGDDDCAQLAFVFDYSMTSAATLHTITADDVYPCADVLVDQVADADFAVVRLDREVTGRTPAPLDVAAPALAAARPLVVNGFPSGLPLKIADGAAVRDPRADTRDFFIANLDTFGGNSGSGVFDDTTKQLVGILVRGEDDYVPDQGAGCSRVNVCPDAGCTGEESTYAFRALEALCASGQGGDFACECGDGTCDGDETQGGCCIDCGCPGAADQCVVGHCASPAQPGDTCDQPLEIAAEGTQTITGDTFLAGDDLAGGCDVGEAPDRVYTFTLAGPTAVDAQAGGYDTGLYLRTDCADVSTEVACNDDIVLGEDRGSHITATLSAGTYYLVVDGFDAAGAYTLTVTFEPTGCPDRDGDGVCDVDDACADDPEKSQPGECGCGVADSDTDSDATADCADPCPDDPDDECAAGDGGGGGGCSTAPGPGGSGSPGLILLALGLAALCLRLPERTGTKKIAGSRPARMLTNVGGGGSSMGCSGQRRGEGAMLRYRADRQTVLYMITATALLFWQWSRPEFSAPLFVWACFMAVTITVIAHNHNHLGMWRSRTGNFLTDYWLTLLYGFPAFAWIPTHNQNHHKFNNREGDYTITYRYSERNNLVTLLTYPTVSGYHQQKPIRDHLRHLWATRRRRFWFSISQYGLLVLLIGGGLLLDWRKALLYIVVPQQFGLFMVLVFNYLQHVHADEESEFNHSRNLVGRALNFFLLNNGYHTVHHESPGTHWSRLPEAHAAIADRIDPRLNERSFWWMMVRMFLLSPFVPRLRSRSLRLERIAGLSASRARAA